MSKLPITYRRAMVASWDALSWVMALVLFITIRYDFGLSDARWAAILGYVLAAIVLTVAGGYGFHLYMGRSRVGSFDEASSLALHVAVIAVALGVVVSLIPAFPNGVGLLVPPLALLFMGFGRWLYRGLERDWKRNPRNHAASTPTIPAALVYGAGEDGHDVARLVDHAVDPPYRIVGFIDDDVAKKYRRIRSYRVLGRGPDVPEMARSTGAQVVILAISAASRELIDTLAQQCRDAGMKLVVVPPVRERIHRQVSLGQLREFNVEDLLGRRPIRTDLSEISDYITGKVVLVTGAGGSIGSELSRQVHRFAPSKLILLDRDESALHALQLSIYGVGLLDTDDMVLCDIRDKAALLQVFRHHKPEVVFHAAALKHLPMLEMYPLEGWKTNVRGTLNVLDAAHETGVDTLVNISTDKAADPTNVLGQTKRIAERLTSWYAGQYGVRYQSVRFGNVLGSRGSVLHTFRSQIERGGPVTVTHPDVTRFFMTIPEACELVLQAGAIGRPRDVMVLDMGEPIRIVDVARRLIEESHRTDIEITYTGLRHGEKLHEVLFSALEEGEPSDHALIRRVTVPEMAPSEVHAASVLDQRAVEQVLSRQMIRPRVTTSAPRPVLAPTAEQRALSRG